MANPNLDLKSRNSQWICQFQGRGVASQLARQLGPRGGHGGYTQKWSIYIHTHDRLDKLRSALAEAQLTTQITQRPGILLLISNALFTLFSPSLRYVDSINLGVKDE